MAGTVRTTNFTINLGLNGNPHTGQDSIEILKAFGLKFDKADYVQGEYKNNGEPTLVGSGSWSTTEGGNQNAAFGRLMEKMCIIFVQDAIPYQVGWHLETEAVAHHRELKEEDKIVFDSAYYLT